MNKISVAVAFSSVLAVNAVAASGQLPAPTNPEAQLSASYTGKSFSPYAGRNFPSRPLFGETHLHTMLSFVLVKL